MKTSLTFEEMVVGNQVVLLNALSCLMSSGQGPMSDLEIARLLREAAEISDEWLRQHEPPV